ncbi:S-adenosylmethionine decarboxylase family protein [Rhodopirellula sp. JC639]|uniref:S-adenosylmethionine decarboxylase family protein n=1 Tax=Stieleria mannarensis TaxID=2755585 RepID=UPI001603A43C
MDERVQGSEPLADFVGGTEWMIDASGCAADPLRDLQCVQSLCRRVVADLELTIVGQPTCHAFPGPGGVTALYLLSESHLACHTYPEHEFATFNLYCCRRRPAWPWRQELERIFHARDVVVRELHRDLRVTRKESLR